MRLARLLDLAWRRLKRCEMCRGRRAVLEPGRELPVPCPWCQPEAYLGTLSNRQIDHLFVRRNQPK